MYAEGTGSQVQWARDYFKFPKLPQKAVMALGAGYYEAHVTTDPPENDSQRGAWVSLAKKYGFHMAKLYMDKKLTPTTSMLDAFFTARHEAYMALEIMVSDLCDAMKVAGVTVRRYKIERVVMDTKNDGDWLKVL